MLHDGRCTVCRSARNISLTRYQLDHSRLCWKVSRGRRLRESRYLPVHTHPFNGPLSGTTRVRRYQKGKINLDFTEARDSEWQWHQLHHMQVCTSLQTDNHTSTPLLSFLQARCPSSRPANSIKALTIFYSICMVIVTK